MRLIIDIPEIAYEAYKEWHKNKVATVEQSLIANGKPYEERPQGDLISRSELKKCAIPCQIHNGALTDLCVPLYQINNAPTVEYTFEEAFQKTVCENKLYCPSRPQGEWYYNYQNGWHCSLCHETVKDMPTVMGKAVFNFCPNCGAKMRKGGAE